MGGAGGGVGRVAEATLGHRQGTPTLTVRRTFSSLRTP